MTDSELDKVLDTKESKGFGKYASDIITDVSKGYKCIKTPCSKEELAHMQFVDSKVTMNIIEKYKDIADFLKQTETVMDWGYPRAVPLEYDYFSENRCNDKNGLTEDGYLAITQGPYKLSDFQNAINFVIDIDTGNNIDHYTDLYKTTAKSLFCSLRYMTQDSLLGGLLVKKQPEQIIFGYDEPIIGILREGNFTKGSDPSVQTHVSINYVYYNNTLINTTNIEVFTGNRHPDRVKTTRSINGGFFLNNIVPFYNGTNVTYGNINPYSENINVVGTDGLQFGKNLDKKKITLFDTRKIQEINYKFTGSQNSGGIKTYAYEMDASKLKKENNKAKRMNFDGFFNISSNFKLPLAASPGYFDECESADYGKVTFDGKNPSEFTSNVVNRIAVEPISGFMISTERNELLSIDVHEKYLSLPGLDQVHGFIPIMGVQQNAQIDEKVFLNKYKFVNHYTSLKFWFRVFGYPIAGISLLASLLFFLLLRKFDNKKELEYEPTYDKLNGGFENEEKRLIKNNDSHGNVKSKYNQTDYPVGNDTTEIEELNEDDDSP
jgi:hypothetical protein